MYFTHFWTINTITTHDFTTSDQLTFTNNTIDTHKTGFSHNCIITDDGRSQKILWNLFIKGILFQINKRGTIYVLVKEMLFSFRCHKPQTCNHKNKATVKDLRQDDILL